MTGKIQNIMVMGGDIAVIVVTKGCCEFKGDEIVEVKKQTKKRSLSANAYFHVLSDKIADATPCSKAHAKNSLLGSYGQRERDENGNVITLAVKEGIDLTEREDIHTVLVDRDLIKGEWYDIYEVVRGSHTYDTREMSILIEGTIQEAKNMGIETMTPQEIARLEGIAQHYSKK